MRPHQLYAEPSKEMHPVFRRVHKNNTVFIPSHIQVPCPGLGKPLTVKETNKFNLQQIQLVDPHLHELTFAQIPSFSNTYLIILLALMTYLKRTLRRPIR